MKQLRNPGRFGRAAKDTWNVNSTRYAGTGVLNMNRVLPFHLCKEMLRRGKWNEKSYSFSVILLLFLGNTFLLLYDDIETPIATHTQCLLMTVWNVIGEIFIRIM